MKNLKLKALSLGIVSTLLISSSTFAATTNNTSTKTNITKTNVNLTAQKPAIKAKSTLESFNYGPDGGPTASILIQRGVIIRRGDIGLAVEQVQAALHVVHGYSNLSVDGIFGPATENAVEDFQRRNGLSPDGEVGPQTWARL